MIKKYRIKQNDENVIVITDERNNQTSSLQLLNDFSKYKIFLFDGQMGAGKTTFIKELCKEMGVRDVVNSPTFSIINVYQTDQGNEIYHFDCYRLKNSREAMAFGAEDYLYSGNYCFIEWPEIISDILPEQTVEVKIEVISEKEREITAETK